MRNTEYIAYFGSAIGERSICVSTLIGVAQ